MGAFECRGELVGTIRFIPMDRGLAPCEEILQRQSLLPAHFYEGSWEVGRLVLTPEYRSGAEALKQCLLLTFRYLLATTNIRNGFAMCNPVLGRLYRRFGFSVLVSRAWEGPTGSFSLIHGSVPAVLRALTGGETAGVRQATEPE